MSTERRKGLRLSFIFGMLAACTMLCILAACGDDGAATTCAADRDCSSGQVCEMGFCKRRATSCKIDNDCEKGRICLEGSCREPQCVKTGDCSGSERCVDGRCVSDGEGAEEGVPVGDGSSSETAPDAGDPVADSGELPPDHRVPDNAGNEEVSEGGPHEAPPDESSVCIPNKDGVIERKELRFAVGSSIIYSVAGSSSKPITVDLKGKKAADGKTEWDLSAKMAGATRIVEELLDPNGSWYAKEFKNATYASMLDRSLGLLGVFQVKPDALLMLGQVSKKPKHTKVKYDKGAALMKFPLKPGAKWKASVSGSGSITIPPAVVPVPYSSSETYEFEVDAVGRLKLPTGTYPVVRIKMKFSQQRYLPTMWRTSNHQHMFVSECFGIVAQVKSKDYESDPFFTKAASVKRLSN